MIYGDRIKQVREYRGLTQEELAIDIGIDVSTIVGMESGNIEVDKKTMLSIAFKTGFPKSFFQQPPSDLKFTSCSLDWY